MPPHLVCLCCFFSCHFYYYLLFVCVFTVIVLSNSNSNSRRRILFTPATPLYTREKKKKNVYYLSLHTTLDSRGVPAKHTFPLHTAAAHQPSLYTRKVGISCNTNTNDTHTRTIPAFATLRSTSRHEATITVPVAAR